jgi:hypothetical protein
VSFGNTELVVDLNSGARCAICDSRAPGAERYLWTLTVFSRHQVAAGAPGRLRATFAGRGGVGGLRGASSCFNYRKYPCVIRYKSIAVGNNLINAIKQLGVD